MVIAANKQQQLFKNLGSQIIFGFHDKLYVETAIWSVFIFVFPIYNSFPIMIY